MFLHTAENIHFSLVENERNFDSVRWFVFTQEILYPLSYGFSWHLQFQPGAISVMSVC